jgi:endonuclease/exonuclease/phosphatase (EEP) superfamily protein YafD
LLSRSGAERYWPVWLLVAPILVWTAIRVFGLERGYPLVGLMAFTPCVAVAALLATGVSVALCNWAAGAAAALATVCLAAAVLPRAVGSELETPAGRQTVTVLAANIHHGTADPEALVTLVERLHPDLLSVEELTPSFARKLRADGIDRLLPESHLAVHTNVSGTGLYARHPLRALPEPARFQFRMPRALMALPGGRSLRVVAVHPYPPLRGRVDEWSAALGSLPTAGAGVPWVLPGDFNATLDLAKFRGLVGRGYRDAAAAAGKGLEPTWPVGRTMPPLIAIDHVLVDRRLGIAAYGALDLPGSDHRAIYAQLVLP